MENQVTETTYLSIREVAELLRISTKTVYHMIHSGELKAFKVRPRRTAPWRIPEAELRRFIAANSSQTQQQNSAS